MKKSLYFLMFAALLFTSCNDDEVPQIFLSGTYEKVLENPDTGVWYSNQLRFKSDGTLERYSIARESENGTDLGFSYYSKETYILKGEEFVTKQIESSHLKDENYPTGYTENLEDLEMQELAADAREFTVTLRRLDSGERISISSKCGPLENCIGEQIYDKVD
jgi:hypothetical protein